MRPFSREVDENEHHARADRVHRHDVGSAEDDRRRERRSPVMGAKQAGRQAPPHRQRDQRRVRREAGVGRLRHVPVDADAAARRRGGRRGRHAGAEAEVPGALHRGQAEVGRDGDHRAGRRLGRRRDHRPPPRSTATTGCSTARRSSSPPASARCRTRKASWWCGRASTSSAGRAGIKSFVVDHHTPGMTVVEDRAQARHPLLGHGRDRVRELPHPEGEPARRRRGQGAVEPRASRARWRRSTRRVRRSRRARSASAARRSSCAEEKLAAKGVQAALRRRAATSSPRASAT